MSKNKKNGLVLVGFGKLNLVDLIKKLGDPENDELLLAAPANYPPRYRRMDICSINEMKAHIKYVEWMSQLISEYEGNEKNG